MRKSRWLYYICSVAVPHIMIVIGLILLSRKNPETKILGKHICITSAVVLAVGSLAYYIFFTPMFGLD